MATPTSAAPATTALIESARDPPGAGGTDPAAAGRRRGRLRAHRGAGRSRRREPRQVPRRHRHGGAHAASRRNSGVGTSAAPAALIQRHGDKIEDATQTNDPPPTAAAAALPVDARSRQIVRIVLALALVALAAWIAADFLPALAWAIVIAITTWPLYVRFAALIPQPLRASRRAGCSFTLFVGIVLLIPLMLALQQLAQASDAAVRWVAELQKSGVPVPPWIAQLPFTGDLLVEWWQTNLSDPQAAAQWLRGVNLESVTAWTRALGGEVLHRLHAVSHHAAGAVLPLSRRRLAVGARARHRRPLPRRSRRAAGDQDRRSGARHRQRHGGGRGGRRHHHRLRLLAGRRARCDAARAA